MKVKVTATITYETELKLEDYAYVVNGPETDDEIIDFEMEQTVGCETGDSESGLLEALWRDGVISNPKIEKLEETAAPAAEKAA